MSSCSESRECGLPNIQCGYPDCSFGRSKKEAERKARMAESARNPFEEKFNKLNRAAQLVIFAFEHDEKNAQQQNAYDELEKAWEPK